MHHIKTNDTKLQHINKGEEMIKARQRSLLRQSTASARSVTLQKLLCTDVTCSLATTFSGVRLSRRSLSGRASIFLAVSLAPAYLISRSDVSPRAGRASE